MAEKRSPNVTESAHAPPLKEDRSTKNVKLRDKEHEEEGGVMEGQGQAVISYKDIVQGSNSEARSE